MHLNVFNDAIRAIRAEDMTMQELPRLCSWVKEQCQMQYGITEGTFFRVSPGSSTNSASIWNGRIRPPVSSTSSTTFCCRRSGRSAVPWMSANGTLRSVARYHAFRRVHPRGMSPEKVAGFLLLNGQFARSVVASLRRARVPNIAA